MLFDERAARAASIPLVLWVCAAVVAHYAGGVGTMQVAEVVHDRDVLKAASRSVRQSMRPGDTVFEVLTDDAKPTPAAKVEAPKEDAPTDGTKPEGEPEPDAVKDKVKPPPPAPKEKAQPKPEPPKVAEKPPPPKPPEPLKPVVPVPAAPAPPPPPPPPPPEDHRIAVRQHAQKDQPDNPEANRVADDANHVEKETMARNRSHDQDMKDPSFGAAKGPKDDKPGAGDKEDKVADSEDKKGNEKHAPGEKNDRATDAHHETPRPPMPPSPQPAKAPPPSVPGGKGGSGATPASPPPSPGGAGPAAAETLAAEKGGGYTLDPANPGGDGKSRTPGKARAPEPFQSPVKVGSLGLGGPGLPGGPQLNLDMKGVETAVGAEQLRAERAADGAARRSAHRGSFEKNKFQKWKAAIENYEPLVELGNTTALNAARSPFATYLNTIHNRIHPIFAEEFLASLDALSRSHQLNQNLVTHLEIVVSKDTGRIVSLGVTRASGATAFDVAALASVDRAGPFGKAPDIIASPDGNVYLHWEFHRDPFDACTTRNARPYILKNAPTKKAAPLGPRKKPGAGPRPDEGAPAGPLLPLRERQ
ncbi:extensin-like protein [Minicystis rosea]|nr:extensin-like protein [Minicystis rosea]